MRQAASALRIDQWEVLRHLTAGPLSVSELSERLSRSPSSVTRSLETFKGQGLVMFSAEHNHAAPNRPKGRWALTKRGCHSPRKLRWQLKHHPRLQELQMIGLDFSRRTRDSSPRMLRTIEFRRY